MTPSATTAGPRPVRRALVGLTVVGVLGLAACGSPPTTSGSGAGRAEGPKKIDPKDCPVKALDEAKGPVKVNLWFSGLVDPALSVLTDMAKRYRSMPGTLEWGAMIRMLDREDPSYRN